LWLHCVKLRQPFRRRRVARYPQQQPARVPIIHVLDVLVRLFQDFTLVHV
jgi:hypothetical protein